MNREQTVALWRQGKDAWNDWASVLLDARKDLEQSGLWDVKMSFSDELEPDNEKTAAWLQAAKADFSGHEFDRDAVFDGFLFPGETAFSAHKNISKAGGDAAKTPVRFKQAVNFDGATFAGFVSFRDAIFEQEICAAGTCFTSAVEFRNARFRADARFTGTRFHDASFDTVCFDDAANFKQAIFYGYAGFEPAAFRKSAIFDNTTFGQDAGFDGARFVGDANFRNASFEEFAWFDGAKFLTDTCFNSATFNEESGFHGVTFKGNTSFDDAAFKAPTAFHSANFHGTTSFNNTSFLDPSNHPRHNTEKN